MPQSIHPVRVNHLNVVLKDFDAGVAHMRDIYGGEFLMDLSKAEFRACLVHLGRTIFEYFVPHDFLINSRYGPHYLGLEYHADMAEVRAAVADHGVGIVRDIGMALHTDPADCFGVAYEFYDGQFHDWDWEPLGGAKLRPADYWRDEDPLGLTGLHGHSHAVWDIAAAGAFLQSFLSAQPLYEARRPVIAARAAGFRIADVVVELVTPDGAGPLHDHLLRHGQGIRSALFGVRDLAQAQALLASRGVPLVPGSIEGALAVPAEANLGLIFEFGEFS